MKLDDILQADNTTTAMLDPALLKALSVFGFVGVTYQLYHSNSGVYTYVGVIEGTRKDGSTHTWTGTGSTPDDAQDDVIDALAHDG